MRSAKTMVAAVLVAGFLGVVGTALSAKASGATTLPGAVRTGTAPGAADPAPAKRSSAKAHKRAFLGVYMQDVDEELAEAMELDAETGVLVDEIVEQSPAEEAGLESGDIILALGDKEIEDTGDLRRVLRKMSPGDEVEVTVLRDGEKKTIEVVLGEPMHPGGLVYSGGAPDDEDASVFVFGGGAKLGVSTHDVDEKLGKYFKTDEGVLVLEVGEASAAEKAGIEVGDVIVKVDEEAVSDTEELRDVLREHEEGDEVEVTVLRDGRKKKLAVELDAGSMEVFADSFRFEGMPHMRWRGRAPRPHRIRIETRDEIEELRKAIEELREEIERLKE